MSGMHERARSRRRDISQRLFRGGLALSTVLLGVAGATLAGLATAQPAGAQSCPVQVINGTDGEAGSGQLVLTGTSTPATSSNWGTDWTNCNVALANLSHDNFSGLTLTNVNFSETVLTDATFSGNAMTNTEFASNLPYIPGNANSANTELGGASFTGVNLSNANFSGAYLGGATLSGTLHDVSFYGADVSSADLGGADLTGSSFEHAIDNATGFAGSTLTNVSSGQIDDEYGVSYETALPSSLPTNFVQSDGYLLGPDVNLGYAGLSGVNLSGLDLDGADLYLATFDNVDLAGATFTGATLYDTGFSGSPPGDCDLTGADLRGLSVDASFSGCILTNTDFTGATFTQVSTGAGGNSGTPIGLPVNWVADAGYLLGPGAGLYGADLAGLNLSGIDLLGANLSYVSSGGITDAPVALQLSSPWLLVDGYLVGPSAELANANLTGQDLAGADLDNADLTNAQLAGANLNGITSGGNSGAAASLPTGWTQTDDYLVGPGSNLTAANFSFANLDNIDFSGTNLTNADLQGATVTGANFNGATWSNTTCPDGTNSDTLGTCDDVSAVATATGPGAVGTASGAVSSSASGGNPGDTLTSTQYGSNPETALSDSTGNYFDVAVNMGAGFTSVTITDCDPGLGSSSALDWYDTTTSSWEPMSPGGFDATTGCLVYNLNTTTSSPTISQLTGTVLGEVTNSGLGITTASPLTAGLQDGTYTVTLSYQDGIAPVAWSVVSGALPTGLRLSSSTGTISGTPTGFGTSNFTIEAVDHSPSPQTATKAFSLTVDQADPTITRISPSTGASAGGTKVTVTGHFLNGGSITFGGVAGNDTTVNTSGTSLVTYTPAGTAGTTVDVDLTTPGGSADAGDAFTYQGPTITRLSASSGPGNGGTRVTITGTFLQGATAVTFGGTAAASYTVSSAGTSITAYTPAEQADGPVDVTVTTPGGGSATDAGSFTFLAPTESRLSPTSGPADVSTKVTIAGADLQGTSAVSFGGVAAASYSVNSSGTSLVAYTPTTVGAGMVDVLVTTPGGTLDIPNGFTFGAPTVTRVNPDTGPAGGGAKVTITGTFLAGTEAVSFGGVGGTGLTVNGTGTSLTVDTPTYGLSGAQAVEVYTPNGTIDAGTYTFEPPTVSHVSPSSGPAYTSDTVTITGTNLTGASAVTFGGVEATSYTVNPAGTSISAVTPSSVGPGTVAVQVTTVGGTSSATVTPYDRFTFG